MRKEHARFAELSLEKCSKVENRKIKNATATTYNNIQFKSKLEALVYKTLLQAGFNPEYEALKFVIWEGIKPSVPFYNRNNHKEFVLENKKMIDVTYTPDFTFKHKDCLMIIEAKGMENDTFPIKKKLFRKHLETLGFPCMYFEVRTKKELLQSIDIIKSYANGLENRITSEASSPKRRIARRKVSKRSKL